MNDYSDVSRTQIERVIDEYIHNERNRHILKRKLLDGIFYEPLAEEVGLSVRQVKNIVYKNEPKIFRHLRSSLK